MPVSTAATSVTEGTATEQSGDEAVPSSSDSDGEPSPTNAALVEAAATGERVEVVAKRTEWDSVFAEPSGQLTLESSIAAVRTRVGAKPGEWRGIDTSLQKSADGISPVASALPMSFSPGGDDHPLGRIERDGHVLELWWPEALPAPTVGAGRLTYADVYAGVDLVVTVDPDGTGFSEVLVVSSPRAAAALPDELSLRTETSDGLEVLPEDGGFTVADAATGDQVFDTPQPAMWDSSGAGGANGLGVLGSDQTMRIFGGDARSLPDRVEQPLDGDKVANVATTVVDGRIGLVPDRAMLTSPGTVWPVYVDPSTSGSRNFWTMIQSGVPNSTSGYKFSGDAGMGLCDVQVISACNRDNVKRLMWGFGSVGEVRGAEVSSATFRAYGVHSYSCSATTVRAYRVDSFGSDATWNNRSGWGSSRQVAYRTVAHKPACPDDQDRWIEFNVTEGAQWAADHNKTALYMGLRAKYENSMSAGWKRYRYDARLSVTFNHKPNRPTNPRTTSPSTPCRPYVDRVWINDRTPVLRATFTDKDGQNVRGHFYWQKRSSDGSYGAWN